ncbi:MAG TPA: MFS transporter [Mycobacteriales bacterium]|nr:MFS transporter [Mycobacteriales bacterium]
MSRARRYLLDLSPVRESRGFRNLTIGDTISIVGTQVTAVAIPLQVYDQTRSAAAVGLVGLVGLVPLVVLGLYGGAVADAVDRRKLVLATTAGQAALSGLLAFHAVLGLRWTWLLYVVIAVQSALFALEHPARTAFVPRLLPARLLPSANALRLAVFNLGLTLGPLIAGLLVAGVGFSAAYLVDALSFVGGLWAVASLPSMEPEGGGRPAGLASVIEGLRFLGTRQVLLMTFVVDIVAMVFGMPRALFPSLADGVFDGGASTVGAMFSALAAGALVGAVLGGWFGRVHRQGLAVLVAIVAWGLCITGFGLTSSLLLGLVLLAGAGAADMVSAAFRTSILQSFAPDEMRGRLGGVFIVVVAGGPRLGDGRAGGMASWLGVQESVWVGGLLVIGLTLAIAAFAPRFVRYDVRHHAPASPPASPTSSEGVRG